MARSNFVQLSLQIKPEIAGSTLLKTNQIDNPLWGDNKYFRDQLQFKSDSTDANRTLPIWPRDGVGVTSVSQLKAFWPLSREETTSCQQGIREVVM